MRKLEVQTYKGEPRVLRTKCILHDPYPQDGRRISVMSRHTLDDGTSPDVRLAGRYDEHYPQLGPSPKLIGDYYKRGLSWGNFEERYVDGLTGKLQRVSIAAILSMLNSMTVTLMCVEETPERCHRRLLAEAIQKLDSGVLVDMR